jgi:hypothetical protein
MITKVSIQTIQTKIKELVAQYLEGQDFSTIENQIRIALTVWIQKETDDIENERADEKKDFSCRRVLKASFLGPLNEILPLENNFQKTLQTEDDPIEQEDTSQEEDDSMEQEEQEVVLEDEYDTMKQKKQSALHLQKLKNNLLLKYHFDKALDGQEDETNPIPNAFEKTLDIFFFRIQQPSFKNETPFQFFWETLHNKFRDNVKILKKNYKPVHNSSKNDIIYSEKPEDIYDKVMKNWYMCYNYYTSSVSTEQNFTNYFDEVCKEQVKSRLKLKQNTRRKVKMLLMVNSVLEEMQACYKRHYYCQNKNYCTNTQCWVNELCRDVLAYAKDDKRIYQNQRSAVSNSKEAILKNYEKKLKLKGII